MEQESKQKQIRHGETQFSEKKKAKLKEPNPYRSLLGECIYRADILSIIILFVGILFLTQNFL